MNKIILFLLFGNLSYTSGSFSPPSPSSPGCSPRSASISCIAFSLSTASSTPWETALIRGRELMRVGLVEAVSGSSRLCMIERVMGVSTVGGMSSRDFLAGPPGLLGQLKAAQQRLISELYAWSETRCRDDVESRVMTCCDP
jgi:hypothetical protein